MTNLRIESAAQAQQNPEYMAALKELLLQLADDDFILAYRGSEWLGLAPHIEEDVAFSSMSQDMMGHAVMFYEMMEELGFGSADDIAQLRKPEEFRNAVLVERPNGSGHYIHSPQYDWAYAIVRSYFYGLFKQVRLDALLHSSYHPLMLAARKMTTEHRYHLMHWALWLKQLANSTDDARARIQDALARVYADLGGLFPLGPQADAIVKHSLIADEATLTGQFLERAEQALTAAGLTAPGAPQAPALDGRSGEHTQALTDALNTLSEVYRLDPATAW